MRLCPPLVFNQVEYVVDKSKSQCLHDNDIYYSNDWSYIDCVDWSTLSYDLPKDWLNKNFCRVLTPEQMSLINETIQDDGGLSQYAGKLICPTKGGLITVCNHTTNLTTEGGDDDDDDDGVI